MYKYIVEKIFPWIFFPLLILGILATIGNWQGERVYILVGIAFVIPWLINEIRKTWR
jgi:hypothetical protein